MKKGMHSVAEHSQRIVFPSEVRKVVLEGHVALRTEIVAVESALEAFQRESGPGREAAQSLLETRFTAFTGNLLAHIELEESSLKPCLAEADAWGDVRVAHMVDEHKRQRGIIRELLALRGQPKDARRLATGIREFLDEVLEDMRDEERNFLSGDVLRDDVVSISGCSE